jgi:hypothetical protein
MSNDIVQNDEMLFRSVSSDQFSSYENGTLRLSTTSFNDRGFKPSVDRGAYAKSTGLPLVQDAPVQARQKPTDGVVQLRADEIRSIAVVTNPQAAPVNQECHIIDVVPRPVLANNAEGISENLAHAQIEAAPAFAKNRIHRLKEALARLAEKRGWIVLPEQ